MSRIEITPEIVALYRMAMCALAEEACGGAKGVRSKLEPRYVEVTQGRDGPTDAIRRGYSSCGDLGNWLLERVGVDASLLNREPGHYRIGWNVAKLSSAPLSEPVPREAPRPGDICIVKSTPTSRDDHVCVALEGGVAGTLRTANYGAGGMSPSTIVGARISSPPIVWQPHVALWRIGAKNLYRIVRVENALRFVRNPPNLEGAALSGEVLDAVDALWH